MKLSFTILGCILYASVSMGQVGGNELYSTEKKSYAEIPRVIIANDNTITIEANVLLNAVADYYVAIFNVNQLGETAESTNQMIDSRINSARSGFVQFGINEKDIYIDMLTFVPEYEYEVQKKLFSKTYNEVPKGFRLQKNIHVKYTDSKMLDKLIEVCAKSEIFDLVKVEYFSANSKAYYDTIRMAAKKILKEKIKDFKELGIDTELAFKQMGENIFVKYPGEQYSSYKAFNSSSLEALKKNSGVTQTIKNSSFYYNPVSYKDYDQVINPVITEPVIQYAISMKLRIVLNKAVDKKNDLYLITPNGDLKLIDK
ncbi:MAG: SIMPL domain-containing protein [Bacteroidales bacterium]|nr:SIMPL domain-containing protein [Bacteroidales bacterium]